jgi:hypothetical protein
MATYTAIQYETIQTADGIHAATSTRDTVSDVLNILASPVGTKLLNFLQALHFHETFSYSFKPGGSFIDGIVFKDTPSIRAIFHPVLTEHVAFHDALIRHIAVLVSQGIAIHDALNLAFKTTLLSKLLFKDNFSTAAKYVPVLMDAIRLHDTLRIFLGGALSDQVALHTTLTPLWRLPVGVEDDLTLMDDLALGQLMFKFVVADDFIIEDDAEVLKAIYSQTLTDTIEISAAYISPDGNLTTWVINTRTGAITEYENFNFNSYARLGNHFYAANKNGLWKLDGDLDNGVAIPTLLKGGYLQLGGSHFQSFKAIYLGLRVRSDQADFYFKLLAGDGREYIYKVRPNSSSGIWNVNNPDNLMVTGSSDASNRSIMTTRINLGKGLRARYFSWELYTPGGEDYDLESIEFVPIVAKRRI